LIALRTELPLSVRELRVEVAKIQRRPLGAATLTVPWQRCWKAAKVVASAAGLQSDAYLAWLDHFGRL
jgi:hypothetical protein